MIAFSLAAVRALARRFVLGDIRAYTVPCGCFGRRALVWDCLVLHKAPGVPERRHAWQNLAEFRLR